MAGLRKSSDHPRHISTLAFSRPTEILGYFRFNNLRWTAAFFIIETVHTWLPVSCTLIWGHGRHGAESLRSRTSGPETQYFDVGSLSTGTLRPQAVIFYNVLDMGSWLMFVRISLILISKKWVKVSLTTFTRNSSTPEVTLLNRCSSMHTLVKSPYIYIYIYDLFIYHIGLLCLKNWQGLLWWHL